MFKRKNFPVVAEQQDWQKKGSYPRIDPWTIAFIYPMEGEPFLLKGGLNFVEDLLNKMKVPAVYFKSMWYQKTSRGYFKVNRALAKKGISLYHTDRVLGITPPDNKTKHKMISFRTRSGKLIHQMRRWPGIFPKEVIEFLALAEKQAKEEIIKELGTVIKTE